MEGRYVPDITPSEIDESEGVAPLTTTCSPPDVSHAAYENQELNHALLSASEARKSARLEREELARLATSLTPAEDTNAHARVEQDVASITPPHLASPGPPPVDSASIAELSTRISEVVVGALEQRWGRGAAADGTAEDIARRIGEHMDPAAVAGEGGLPDDDDSLDVRSASDLSVVSDIDRSRSALHAALAAVAEERRALDTLHAPGGLRGAGDDGAEPLWVQHFKDDIVRHIRDLERSRSPGARPSDADAGTAPAAAAVQRNDSSTLSELSGPSDAERGQAILQAALAGLPESQRAVLEAKDEPAPQWLQHIKEQLARAVRSGSPAKDPSPTTTPEARIAAPPAGDTPATTPPPAREVSPPTHATPVQRATQDEIDAVGNGVAATEKKVHAMTASKLERIFDESPQRSPGRQHTRALPPRKVLQQAGRAQAVAVLHESTCSDASAPVVERELGQLLGALAAAGEEDAESSAAAASRQTSNAERGPAAAAGDACDATVVSMRLQEKESTYEAHESLEQGTPPPHGRPDTSMVHEDTTPDPSVRRVSQTQEQLLADCEAMLALPEAQLLAEGGREDSPIPVSDVTESPPFAAHDRAPVGDMSLALSESLAREASVEPMLPPPPVDVTIDEEDQQEHGLEERGLEEQAEEMAAVPTSHATSMTLADGSTGVGGDTTPASGCTPMESSLRQSFSEEGQRGGNTPGSCGEPDGGGGAEEDHAAADVREDEEEIEEGNVALPLPLGLLADPLAAYPAEAAPGYLLNPAACPEVTDGAADVPNAEDPVSMSASLSSAAADDVPPPHDDPEAAGTPLMHTHATVVSGGSLPAAGRDGGGGGGGGVDSGADARSVGGATSPEGASFNTSRGSVVHVAGASFATHGARSNAGVYEVADGATSGGSPGDPDVGGISREATAVDGFDGAAEAPPSGGGPLAATTSTSRVSAVGGSCPAAPGVPPSRAVEGSGQIVALLEQAEHLAGLENFLIMPAPVKEAIAHHVRTLQGMLAGTHAFAHSLAEYHAIIDALLHTADDYDRECLLQLLVPLETYSSDIERVEDQLLLTQLVARDQGLANDTRVQLARASAALTGMLQPSDDARDLVALDAYIAAYDTLAKDVVETSWRVEQALRDAGGADAADVATQLHALEARLSEDTAAAAELARAFHDAPAEVRDVLATLAAHFPHSRAAAKGVLAGHRAMSCRVQHIVAAHGRAPAGTDAAVDTCVDDDLQQRLLTNLATSAHTLLPPAAALHPAHAYSRAAHAHHVALEDLAARSADLSARGVRTQLVAHADNMRTLFLTEATDLTHAACAPLRAHILKLHEAVDTLGVMVQRRNVQRLLASARGDLPPGAAVLAAARAELAAYVRVLDRTLRTATPFVKVFPAELQEQEAELRRLLASEECPSEVHAHLTPHQAALNAFLRNMAALSPTRSARRRGPGGARELLAQSPQRIVREDDHTLDATAVSTPVVARHAGSGGALRGESASPGGGADRHYDVLSVQSQTPRASSAAAAMDAAAKATATSPAGGPVDDSPLLPDGDHDTPPPLPRYEQREAAAEEGAPRAHAVGGSGSGSSIGADDTAAPDSVESQLQLAMQHLAKQQRRVADLVARRQEATARSPPASPDAAAAHSDASAAARAAEYGEVPLSGPVRARLEAYCELQMSCDVSGAVGAAPNDGGLRALCENRISCITGLLAAPDLPDVVRTELLKELHMLSGAVLRGSYQTVCKGGPSTHQQRIREILEKRAPPVATAPMRSEEVAPIPVASVVRHPSVTPPRAAAAAHDEAQPPVEDKAVALTPANTALLQSIVQRMLPPDALAHTATLRPPMTPEMDAAFKAAFGSDKTEINTPSSARLTPVADDNRDIALVEKGILALQLQDMTDTVGTTASPRAPPAPAATPPRVTPTRPPASDGALSQEERLARLRASVDSHGAMLRQLYGELTGRMKPHRGSAP